MKILVKAVAMHVGWEMDNEIWLLEKNNKTKEIRTTSHGRERVMKMDELDNKIKETKASLNGLMKLKKLAN